MLVRCACVAEGGALALAQRCAPPVQRCALNAVQCSKTSVCPPPITPQAKRVEQRLADKKMKMELHESGGCPLASRPACAIAAPPAVLPASCFPLAVPACRSPAWEALCWLPCALPCLPASLSPPCHLAPMPRLPTHLPSPPPLSTLGSHRLPGQPRLRPRLWRPPREARGAAGAGDGAGQGHPARGPGGEWLVAVCVCVVGGCMWGLTRASCGGTWR